MSTFYDLIVIGSGGAGMAAGIYGGRAQLNTLIIEQDSSGGQVALTADVVNYPGILHSSGKELSETMRKQAKSFGATFVEASVTAVDFSKPLKKVITDVETYEAIAVIIATGAQPKTVGFKGEETYRGRGIGYCATCDGEFFTDMDVFVIGGGFAAAEEALYLTRFARNVTLVARDEKLSCPTQIAKEALDHPKIHVKFNTELIEVGGDTVMRYADFMDRTTNQVERYEPPSGNETFGIFIFAGYAPQSAPFATELALDEQGYILTDERMHTNVAGVFAAGDIRTKGLRQLVTAVADGAVAATEAEHYVHQTRAELSPEDNSPACSADSASDNPSVNSAPAQKTPSQQAGYLDEDFKTQLTPVLARFERPVILTAYLKENDATSDEMRAFLEEFSFLSDKIIVRHRTGDDLEMVQNDGVTIIPAITVSDAEGTYTGIQFHGVPGGHEINSFVIALYNTAGPGQAIDEETLQTIGSINRKVNIKVGVSLSCPLCPDVVAATQLMALKNPHIEAQMVDIAKFPDFKAAYSIMSVPAIVIDDTHVEFGKKDLAELVGLVNAR